MGASIKIGKVLGIPVSLHFSWFIIFFLFTFIFQRHFESNYGSWSPGEMWAAALATSLLLFVSVLAHELSHSLIALSRGIPVNGITLFIFGGVSQIAQEARRPFTEFIVAVVGPFASIALGFAFLGLAIGLDGISRHLSAIAEILFYANIALGVFNMIPGFPMDGGRVLRAVAWRVTRSYWRATWLATMVGQAIALAMIIGGITLAIFDGNNIAQWLWLTFVGVFLQVLASSSHRQSRIRERLQNHTAGDLMISGLPTAPADITLNQIMENYAQFSGSPDVILLTRAGHLEGVITLDRVRQVSHHKWPETLVSSIMIPFDKMVTVGVDEPAFNVMEMIEGGDFRYALVVADGSPVGFISQDALKRIIKSRPVQTRPG